MSKSTTLVLTLLVTIFTLALSLVPEGWSLGGFKLRKMDILADIRNPVTASEVTKPAAEADSPLYTEVDTAYGQVPLPDSAFADSVARAFVRPAVDSVFFGNIIEDYTPKQQNLSRFFGAVDSIRSHGRTVRVAFYGDSFVEGDILLGDLRDTLQGLWGGEGVGFVPITSEVARFKRTLKHEYRGWTPHSIVKKDGNTLPYGINGFVYVPEPEAKVHYEGADYFQHTRRWSTTRLFYSAQQPVSFVWQNEGSGPQEEMLPAGQIKQWKWGLGQPNIRAYAMRFPQTEGLLLYGASLESGPGFYIDNFSLRGNSGGPLMRLQPEIVQKFDTYQHYDLVVVQVGLNAVTNDLKNIRWYEAELQRTFKHLHACFPGKTILIVSVGDRGDKVGTELMTMRGVPAIVAMQRRLAREHGFLFFDLYHAMGGAGTMIRFAQQKPRLANLDYTHLTHEGGHYMGQLFARLMLTEQAKWLAQQGNDNGK
jgi:hypothetical protein